MFPKLSSENLCDKSFCCDMLGHWPSFICSQNALTNSWFLALDKFDSVKIMRALCYTLASVEVSQTILDSDSVSTPLQSTR